MKTILGSFVFRKMGDGCLSGKFINTDMDEPSVESCQLKSTKNLQNNFSGTYTSFWLEDSKTGQIATLEIKQVNNKNKYEVTWERNGEDSVAFRGIGMIYEDYLIGHYED